MRIKNKIKYFKDNQTKLFVALCTKTQLTGYGRTRKQAIEMLKECVHEYRINILMAELEKLTAEAFTL